MPPAKTIDATEKSWQSVVAYLNHPSANLHLLNGLYLVLFIARGSDDGTSFGVRLVLNPFLGHQIGRVVVLKLASANPGFEHVVKLFQGTSLELGNEEVNVYAGDRGEAHPDEPDLSAEVAILGVLDCASVSGRIANGLHSL